MILIRTVVPAKFVVSHTGVPHAREYMEPSSVPRAPLFRKGPSPVNVSRLAALLSEYPCREDAHILFEGFSSGFKLHYDGPREYTDCNNLLSVRENM
jgi:hypothetical protein